MKAIVADKNGSAGLDFGIQEKIFTEAGIDFILEDCQSEDEIIEKCKDADILLVIYQKITPRIMDALPNVKVILRYGIGYDCIDVDAATERGIKVCNSPLHCLDEVATHAVTMILALERKLVMFNDKVREGIWLANIGEKPHRIAAQTVGFIGFGNIAQRTADFIGAFGPKLIAYDPFLDEEVIKSKGAEKKTLDEVLAEADVISIHTPLTKDTYHIINKDTIAKMKDNVILVNTSRGPLVALDDLLEALKEGKIKAAGLDVLETEPNVDTEKVFEMKDRIIVTPHMAYNSVEAENEMMRVLATSAVEVANGNFVPNIVNKKALGLI